VFREVGYVGVTEADRAALAREFRVAEAPLPFERVGSGYYADATVGVRRGERPLRLLVDTGATVTGIAADVLDRLGAERLDRGARVGTASGTVLMPTYRLRSLKIGDLEVGEMVVLGLPTAPADADGLLGMDVLDQLPKLVGMPSDAR